MSLAKKVKQYIEGNLKMLEYSLIEKPSWYKEQILYRASKCEDCYKRGKCYYCGCNLPGKHFVKESCNDGLRFPDLMDEKDWIKYKEDNNIEIDLNDGA